MRYGLTAFVLYISGHRILHILARVFIPQAVERPQALVQYFDSLREVGVQTIALVVGLTRWHVDVEELGHPRVAGGEGLCDASASKQRPDEQDATHSACTKRPSPHDLRLCPIVVQKDERDRCMQRNREARCLPMLPAALGDRGGIAVEQAWLPCADRIPRKLAGRVPCLAITSASEA